MSKDYYSILGVSKSASPEEIKKAFRELAHKHHPDKQGGDEAKFKEANEAYQTLSNAEKRKAYDQFGSNYEQAGAGGSGGQGFNWQDFGGGGGFSSANVDFGDLGDIFGDFFGGGRGGRGGSRNARGADIQMDVHLTFKEAAFGVHKKVELYKNTKCTHCQGTGGEVGSTLITCKTCNGAGSQTQVRRTFMGNIQTSTPCVDCQGQGKFYDKKCKDCGGVGLKKDKVSLEIDIPGGVDTGMTISVSGQGEGAPNNGQSGDLFLQVRVEQDERFERDKDNILSSVEVPYSTMVLGGSIEVQTLEGTEKLKIHEGTQPGSQFVLKGKGAHRFQRGGVGDMIVTVEVQVPTKLKGDQKDLLKEMGTLGL